MLNRVTSHVKDLDKADIARLSNDEISQLTYDAMVEIVLASEMPVRNVERIRTFEGETVSRLAWMARDHCRKQAASLS